MIKVLLDLFPKGPLFPSHNTSFMYRLLRAYSREFERLRSFLKLLVKEREPATSIHLIEEWKTLFGTDSINLAQSYYTGIGGQNLPYIEEQLQEFDSRITVTERLFVEYFDGGAEATSGRPSEYGDPTTQYGVFEYGASHVITITHPADFTQAQIAELQLLVDYYRPLHINFVLSSE